MNCNIFFEMSGTIPLLFSFFTTPKKTIWILMEKCLRMYGNIIEWLKKIKEKTMKHNNMQFLRNLCWIQFFFTLHKMNVILTPQKFEVKSTPMAMVLHCVYVLLVSCSKQNKQRIFCGTRCHLNWIGICAVRWGISIYSRSQENPSYSSQVFWLFLFSFFVIYLLQPQQQQQQKCVAN